MSKQRVEQVVKARASLTKYFRQVCDVFGKDAVIFELMAHRNYYTEDMYDTLKEIGVFKVDNLSELTLLCPASNEDLRKWGLVNEDGNFILRGLYVVPIRDIGGMVIALVGWNPNGGSRKYVTTPTVGFSRDTSFFNYDTYALSWEEYDGLVFLVEGIFDAIALKSIGLPVLAVMGLEMSAIKAEMLNRFSKVVAIPDNDSAGRSVSPYTNGVSGKSKRFVWRIPKTGVFVTLPQGVKDNDDLVRDYDCKEELLECRNAKFIKRLKLTT